MSPIRPSPYKVQSWLRGSAEGRVGNREGNRRKGVAMKVDAHGQHSIGSARFTQLRTRLVWHRSNPIIAPV